MSRPYDSPPASRPGHGTRRAVRGSVVALMLAVGAAACDDVLVAGPLPESGNVEAVVGAAVVQSDTGVVVNGVAVLRHSSLGNALWLDRSETFTFGGFPEIGYPQSIDYGLVWRVHLTHEIREQRGDSLIFRFTDHGDVAVAGVAMEKLTDLPAVGPSVPVRFENFIRYHVRSSIYLEWLHASPTHDRGPFHDDLVAGRPLAVTSTGSDAVAPVTAAFAARPFTALVRIENDGTLPLRGAVPVIDVDHPLALVFDRPLDPERAYIIIHPMHTPQHQQPATRTAFLQPRTPSQRVVIPPHILRQLVGDAPGDRFPFRAIIVDALVEEDVFAGRFTAAGSDDAEFSLPFVQRGETVIHLYLRR
jgi:hypothetical protein